MGKRRLRVALKVLDEVKVQFLETKQFTEECIEQECLKENISADEVIFFRSLEAKTQLRKTFFEYVKRYCIKLNSLGYNIYLRLKLLRIFTDKVDLKKQFCKNDSDGVLLQPLIMQRIKRFNAILKLSYTQHFFCF